MKITIMELNKSENELKVERNKTAKKGSSKFDAKTVDTLFRTISRNHYNLLRMIDNKASIILTVNSIPCF